MRHLEYIVKALGGRKLWVYTSQAREFYEKKGFTFVQKAWIDDSWQEVLRKDLF